VKDLAQEKRNLRAQLRQRLIELSAERLQAASRAACDRLVTTEEFRRAQAVMI
jgi:5-formyltetrahydrofolate cyclo-ligase